jgi:hypothetical protein
MKLIYDEFNMGEPTTTVASSASNNDISADAMNANTFLAGQLIVDMMGTMLTFTNTPAVEFCNLWSVSEGRSFGMIDGTTPKPTVLG